MVMETQQAEPQFKSMFARDLERSDLARSERLPFRRVGSESALMGVDYEVLGYLPLENLRLHCPNYGSVGAIGLSHTNLAKTVEDERTMTHQQVKRSMGKVEERSWRWYRQVCCFLLWSRLIASSSFVSRHRLSFCNNSALFSYG